MVSYRRIYEDRIKRYLTKNKIAGVSLIFGIFMLLVVMEDITITGFSGDQQCAGTEYDPCYAYLNFTANTNIYLYPSNDTTWMLNITPMNAMDRIVMQRSWGNSWRTIDLSKPWSSKVKYAVKFSVGRSYQIRFVGYKKNINETVKWGFGFPNGNYSENTKSYVDPAWIGYNKDSFFTELTDYKAGFTSGYAEFTITNPLNKDIEINKSNLKSLYTVVQGKVLSEEYSFFEVVPTKTIEVDKSVCTDNFVLKQLMIPNNVTGLNETVEQEVNEPICETVKVDEIVPAKKEKKTLGVVIPKKGNLTFRIDLTYKSNTIVDWIPELEIDGTKFKQDDWIWFNDTRDFKRPIVIEGIGLSMPDNYQKLLNIDHDADMQTDFSDIRFTWLNTTDDAEYSIDYWVESQNDGINVTVWAEVPKIYNETTNTTIFIYYGNNSGSVSSESNVSDVLGNGIISFFPFDNDFEDKVSSHDGTAYNTPTSTTDRNGNSNSAYSFDGSTEYMTIADHTDFAFGTGDFTLSVWTFINDNLREEWFFHKRKPSPNYNQFYFNKDSANILTWGQYDGATSNAQYTAEINDAWKLLTVTRNSTGNYIYINAVLVKSESLIARDITSTNPIYIAKRSEASTYFNGKLDDIRIYNTALTASQISSMYAPTEPNYTIGAEETQGESDINWSIWIGSDWANASDYYTDFRCLPTQTNCEPTDQDAASNQCIYKICNNGTADATSLKMNLSSICPNMDFKADDDYTSVDATILTTTLQEVHGALTQNSCVEICMWADYSNPDTCSTYPEPYAELS